MPSTEHEREVQEIIKSGAKESFGSVEKLHVARLFRLQHSSPDPPKSIPSDIQIAKDDTALDYPLYIVTSKSYNGSVDDILYIHGGGYIFPMSERQWLFIFKYVRALNCRVYIPFYPLAPEHKGGDTTPTLLKWWERESNRPITLYANTSPRISINTDDHIGWAIAQGAVFVCLLLRR
jgi:monoterpene epsilon-lactone hydrolase